ncbi:hypothetical protein FACS1894155_06300 [Bacteroidia bacterium]|nr:hypothetical protein FACS189455_5060 [Bacteroidia bacterium]GHU89402.1 hypothetical protein FACS1894155_06300 [Bacteroidia bacterium]
MKIIHFKHHEIDKPAYDECILKSLQGTVYAMSWYLDTVSPGWELLATEDYGIVMPIPVKKKSGLSYSIQPSFCQQLGIFSAIPVEEKIITGFIEHISYFYYRLQLNSGNVFENQKARLQQNYLLDMGQSYEQIRKKYKTNCQRNIRKSETGNLQVFHSTEPDTYVNVLIRNASERPVIKLLPLLKKIIESAGRNAKTEIWNVRNNSGDILSCVFFLYWKNRVYYMVPVSTPQGRKQQSMSFLIDRFIHHHATSGLILDFEGSSIPNIARFYEGFGAFREDYPLVIKDNLLGKVIRCTLYVLRRAYAR